MNHELRYGLCKWGSNFILVYGCQCSEVNYIISFITLMFFSVVIRRASFSITSSIKFGRFLLKWSGRRGLITMETFMAEFKSYLKV